MSKLLYKSEETIVYPRRRLGLWNTITMVLVGLLLGVFLWRTNGLEGGHTAHDLQARIAELESELSLRDREIALQQEEDVISAFEQQSAPYTPSDRGMDCDFTPANHRERPCSYTGTISTDLGDAPITIRMVTGGRWNPPGYDPALNDPSWSPRSLLPWHIQLAIDEAEFEREQLNKPLDCVLDVVPPCRYSDIERAMLIYSAQFEPVGEQLDPGDPCVPPEGACTH